MSAYETPREITQYNRCSFISCSQHLFFCLFGFFDTFHDLSQIFKFVLLFNFVKLLSAFFHIHEALFSLPGTSLASLLSHLNVFNLHRIANHSNDMQNLIQCAGSPVGLLFIGSQLCQQQGICICIRKEMKKRGAKLKAALRLSISSLLSCGHDVT